MSINRITSDDVETFTLETTPFRTYSSNSLGTSGSINVFARRSNYEKEVQPLSSFSSSYYNDENLEEYLSLAEHFSTVSGNNSGQVQGYLTAVHNQQISARKQQEVNIIRFTPPFRFNSNTLRKLLTVNTLMPYYRDVQPNSHFAFGNYHCLNFFTSSEVPEATAILYPNPAVSGVFPYGRYTPTGSWSIDFWINPKYTTDTPSSDFKAGTILHLSGVLAISLVTGSSRDINGFVDGYRILVQLSSSANTSPSLATANSTTIFTSDNSLSRNKWQRVTIRHGGSSLVNNGTGSIFIDTVLNTNFVFTSSIASNQATGGYGTTDGPCVLSVGNYYVGTNQSSNGMARFFAADTSEREGLYELSSVGSVDYPSAFNFTHPLNAELHDLKIFNKFLTTTEISESQTKGVQSLQNLLFYVPPFFTETAPTQSFVGTYGGVLLTPFQTKNDTTKDAFNVSMSLGVGGMYMNLENFGMELTTQRFPRWLNLTGSILSDTTHEISANQFLFATGSVRKRQYTILPCDNGKFVPNFLLLNTASLPNNKYRNDLNNINYGLISLRDLVPLQNPTFGLLAPTGSIIDDIIGASPDNLSGSFSDSMAILHRTRDNTSNQVVLFDISNLYYGNQIKPGSFVLTDSSLSGSGGKISTTIKDDFYGNLYRADSNSTHATWNSIGNIFYNEGIAIIKAPELFFFGENQWEMEFKGEQNIHVMKFNLLRNPLTSLSSSNPSYMPVSASSLANETDEQFVWLSTVYLHDDNLNVVAKTNVAQPIMMKSGDKMMFKIKLDC